MGNRKYKQKIMTVKDADKPEAVGVAKRFEALGYKIYATHRTADALKSAGIKAIKYFSGKGIRTNCTLVFSPGQALLATKAGATYVSPFVGRLDDIASDGIELVRKIVEMYDYYDYETQVLAASIRSTQHIIQCVEAGADVATCPLSAIKGLLKHPLTDSGLATFLADYKKVNG